MTTVGNKKIGDGNSGGAAPSTCSKIGAAAASNSTDIYDHGGPVMGTQSTPGEVTITPIFWTPPGTTATSTSYQNLVSQFDTDVAAASGSGSNVFSNLTQYTDASGHKLHYLIHAGAPITASDAPVAAGTSVPGETSTTCSPDSGSVQGFDGSHYSYTSCITDSQIEAEVMAVTSANSLPTDHSHLYPVFLPRGVESCQSSNAEPSVQCEINAGGTGSSVYCGYHSYAPGPQTDTGAIYSVEPYPVEQTVETNWTFCSQSDFIYVAANGNGVPSNLTQQSPNGNADFDSGVNTYAHEISESITDPYLDAWFNNGSEVADICQYGYPTLAGVDGSQYDQTINGHFYLTQELWSNTAGSCAIGLPTPPAAVKPSSITATVPPTAAAGSPTVVTANVTAPTPGPGAPLGTATIRDQNGNTCVVTLSVPSSYGVSATPNVSTGTCSLPAEPAKAAYTYVVNYGGDDYYQASAGQSSVQIGAPMPVVTTAISTQSTVTSVSTAQLTINVISPFAGAGVPAPQGSIEVWALGSEFPTFLICSNDATLSGVNGVSSESCDLSNLNPGTYDISALYTTSDSNYQSVPIQLLETGPPQAVLTVVAAVPTVNITDVSPDSSTVDNGQDVTVTVTSPNTLDDSAPQPTGEVTITDDSNATCQATLDPYFTGVAMGDCTLPESSGDFSFTASYGGDGLAFAAAQPAQWSTSFMVPIVSSVAPTDPIPVGQSFEVTGFVDSPDRWTVPTGSVTLSLGQGNTCIATLSDDGNGGEASASCQMFASSAGTATLTTSYSGDSNFIAVSDSSTSVEIDQATPNVSIDGPDSQTYGVSSYGPFEVSVGNPDEQGDAPTGTAVVSAGSSSCVVNLTPGTGSHSTGICSMTAVHPGNYSVTAQYNGDGSYAPASSGTALSYVVSKLNAPLNLSLPTSVGAGLQEMAVALVFGPGPATGTVTFTANGAVVCQSVPLTANSAKAAQANCLLSTSTLGIVNVSAVYSGDANFNAPASATQAQYTVVKDTPVTALQSVATSTPVAGVGDAVVVQVAGINGAAPPTGTVTVSDGRSTCTGTLAKVGNVQSTMCQLVETHPGTYTVTATYNGNAHYSSAVGFVTASITVTKSPTSIAITSKTTTSVKAGKGVGVTTTIKGGSGLPSPTGTVTVSDGRSSCTANLPASTALAVPTTCTLVEKTPGTRTVTASYSGDSTYLSGSSSNSFTLTVKKAATTTSISSTTGANVVVAQPDTLSVTVSALVGMPAPSGTVALTAGTASCTATLVPGTGQSSTGSCAIVEKQAGSFTITATYGGSSTYTSSSATTTVNVKKALNTTTLSQSLTNVVKGGSAHDILTITVVPQYAGVNPSGTLTIKGQEGSAAAVVLGTVNLTKGSATFNVPFSLGRGTWKLSASYPGDTHFRISTSNPVTLVVS